MTLTTQITLALAGLAAVLAWWIGGASGAGVLAGALAAASVSGAWLAVQRRIALRQPQFLFHAVLGGFLVKACALLALTALMRYAPPLAERIDWFGFALSFGATTLVLLAPATLELQRSLQMRPAGAGEGRGA